MTQYYIPKYLEAAFDTGFTYQGGKKIVPM
jgi:hypothetical protein